MLDDQVRGFRLIQTGGVAQWCGVGATDIAAADTTGDGKADLVVTYDQAVKTRTRFEAIYMNPAGG